MQFTETSFCVLTYVPSKSHSHLICDSRCFSSIGCLRYHDSLTDLSFYDHKENLKIFVDNVVIKFNRASRGEKNMVSQRLKTCNIFKLMKLFCDCFFVMIELKYMCIIVVCHNVFKTQWKWRRPYKTST